MTTHITARLAWHDDGWNGRICQKPAANTFCVGTHSYPGQLIAEQRKLEWETTHAGKSCKKLDDVPPCCYSMNAFGEKEIIAKADPPHWFNKETKTRMWTLPSSSISIWPYEGMYGEDVKSEYGFDADQRLTNARAYFSAIEPDSSLVFYYANYSNPFSEDERKRYALVGLSRVKSLGEELFYEGCSKEVREKYGGYVWQRSISSHYPDQGLRLPYHLYRDSPEILEGIVLFAENPRLCKYATRQISDDDALGFVEGFLRVVQNLREIKDTAEDWKARTLWLETLISELWRHRGLYPGMCAVLEVLNLQEVIDRFKAQALKGKEKHVHESVFSFLEGRSDSIPGVQLDADTLGSTKRQWKLRTREEQRLLKEVFPLFDLDESQIKKILSEDRSQNGIEADFTAISKNPYILSEQYEGDGPDDIIPWSTIDRGVIPSPEIGGKALAKADDPRRLRALLVESLRMEGTHTFAPADQVIESVNRHLSVLPEWKRFAFHLRYIEADEETLGEALYIRRAEERTYLYLRHVYEDERLLEQKLLYLIGGPDILLRSPVTEATWKGYLYDETSILAQKAEKEYRKAIGRQVEACQRIFIRPLSVLAGEAGTGKTTVIRALVKAIKRGHGTGASVIALAPTGKATDRIREIFEKDESLQGKVEVVTLHSFLAKRKWLNPNMSFKRRGGDVEERYSTYILDESSMLDLELAAAFFRAVRWPTVQRLILVGDPNQLPPIGRGRVFADIIDHIRKNAPESIGTLEQNLRQLTGRLTGGGTGIIDLAQCYVRGPKDDKKNEDLSTAAEIVLQRVQEGGEVDKDLRVLYWNDQEELQSVLTEQIENDMREDVEKEGEDPATIPRDLWRQAVKDDPSRLQILAPIGGSFLESMNSIVPVRNGFVENVRTERMPSVASCSSIR